MTKIIPTGQLTVPRPRIYLSRPPPKNVTPTIAVRELRRTSHTDPCITSEGDIAKQKGMRYKIIPRRVAVIAIFIGGASAIGAATKHETAVEELNQIAIPV